MKISHFVSELHNSTKAILIACSLFLVVTASVLLFLMIYPIKAKDNMTNHSVIVAETTTTTKSLREELTETTREPLHTLSTWGVSIETIVTTEKPDPTTTAWYDAIFTTVSKQEDIYNNMIIPTEPIIVVTEPVIINSELVEIITEPPVQTITETIAQPVITEAPVVTDQLVTAPVENYENTENILDIAPESDTT